MGKAVHSYKQHVTVKYGEFKAVFWAAPPNDLSVIIRTLSRIARDRGRLDIVEAIKTSIDAFQINPGVIVPTKTSDPNYNAKRRAAKKAAKKLAARHALGKEQLALAI